MPAEKSVDTELTHSVLRLPPETHKQLKSQAALRGLTMQTAVIEAVHAYLGVEEELGPSVPKRLRPYLEMAAEVFTGGDPDAISLVTAAVRFAHQKTAGGGTVRKTK